MYSFSQNFEDVYIRRAFADVESGFYIDAGAFDPVIDSVTKMLYDAGWHGINLEPGPSFPTFASRTRDINLSLALSDSAGNITFHYNMTDPGTSSTASSEDIVKIENVRSYNVPCSTLADIVEGHAKDQHIHFLKLDIAGGEWDVLSSTDWHLIRPELILVESTLPYTNDRRDHGWADFMRSFDYEEVFFDGINTYFLRSESLGRRDAFSIPINVLDGFRKFDSHQHGDLARTQSEVVSGIAAQNLSELVQTADSSIIRMIEFDRETDRKAAEERGKFLGYNAATEVTEPLKAELERERKLREALEAERNSHFTGLQDVGSRLSIHSPEGSARPNSPEGLISEIIFKIGLLTKERESLARERDALSVSVEEQRAEAGLQSTRAASATVEVGLLSARLNSARDARSTMLDVTERLTSTLLTDMAARHAVESSQAQDRIDALADELAQQRYAALDQDRKLTALEQLILAQAENERLATENKDNRLNALKRTVDAQAKELSNEFVRGESDASAEVMLNEAKSSFWSDAVRFRTMALVQKANWYRDNERWSEAAVRYSAAYARRPERWDLGLQLANMLARLGAFVCAERIYREAIAKAPTQGITFFHFGHMLQESGRPLRAQIAYQKAIELLPERGDIKHALDEVTKLIERNAS